MFFNFAHLFTALTALTYVGLGLAAPVPKCGLGNRTGTNNSTGSSSGNGTDNVGSGSGSVSNSTSGSNSTGSSGSGSTSSTGPHWVVYSDAWVSGENGPPAVSDITVSIYVRTLRVCGAMFGGSVYLDACPGRARRPGDDRARTGCVSLPAECTRSFITVRGFRTPSACYEPDAGSARHA